MHLRIQRGSAVPISKQIEAQLRAQILAGAAPVDQPLPSVRELARRLGVNVNTIVRVYSKLAAEGWIDVRHGDGAYVNSSAIAHTSRQVAEQTAALTSELDDLTRRALLLGLTPRQLKDLLQATLSRLQAELKTEQASP